MSVKKAIIPAAGLGTRFLPATKAQPKEMLPIVDKPTIQYIVEEAVESGIEDIMIISGRGKRAIEDHFDKSYELEETLLERGKVDRFKQSQKISNLANIHYIRQKEPLGLGHAINCARTFVGDDPFAVLLGDDIVRSDGEACLKQLIKAHERTGASVIGTQQVPYMDVPKYGILAPENQQSLNSGEFKVMDLVEKPSLDEAPSNYAIMGRYVLDPQIFEILSETPPGSGNEIQLTDAIKQMNQTQTVNALEFTGKRYDVGDKFGFIKATIDFALERDDLQQDVQTYLKQIMEEQMMPV